MMKADDGCHYVVKSPENPQGTRVLVNEWLGNWVFTQLGIATPQMRILSVSQDLIDSNDLHFSISPKRPLRPGYHLGSLYPTKPRAIYDYIPSSLMSAVSNRNDFTGALVCDKWLANTDYRQAVFVRQIRRVDGSHHHCLPGFQALMIDNGNLFDGAQWRFVDSSIGGLYLHREVYNHIRGWSHFDPWFAQISGLRGPALERAVLGIPTEWLVGEELKLARLVQRLERRVDKLPLLIEDMWKSVGLPLFVNWAVVASPNSIPVLDSPHRSPTTV